MRIKKNGLDTEVFSERTVTGDLALKGKTSPHLLIFQRFWNFCRQEFQSKISVSW